MLLSFNDCTECHSLNNSDFLYKKKKTKILKKNNLKKLKFSLKTLPLPYEIFPKIALKKICPYTGHYKNHSSL